MSRASKGRDLSLRGHHAIGTKPPWHSMVPMERKERKERLGARGHGPSGASLPVPLVLLVDVLIVVGDAIFHTG